MFSYVLYSVIFWYIGVDAATVSDRAESRRLSYFSGAMALGGRRSTRHWRVHRKLQITMAALAVSLVCSVYSIVGLNFAASQTLGWQKPLFPPCFVLGAMY